MLILKDSKNNQKLKDRNDQIKELEIKLHEGTISNDEFLELCVEKKFHGCSREHIAKELNITPKECRLLLKKLINDGKAYKSYHSCVANEYRFVIEDY